ncbi:hypothetical protein [Cellvibrio sp.]|uniref:hypothetical protein n=1 Tax=Cellvibrio sp. TaxID=1965322 RepID=UPI0039647465
MPTPIVIDFSDLGTSGQVDIPATYKGFNWTGYGLDETFTGSATAIPAAKAISGVGFQMTAVTNSSFDLSSISISRDGGAGQLDITVKAKTLTAQGLTDVASFVVRSPNSDSPTAGVFNLMLKNIHQLQIYSNAMDTFDTYAINVILND